MKIEASGIKYCKRIVRNDGTLIGLIEQLANSKWRVFVDSQPIGLPGDTPKQALNHAKEYLK